MKREIKFRFWNKNTQAFEYDNLDSRETYQNPFSREDLIACQWTGLLDRVGKEIYEGDICHYLRRDYTAFDNDQERTFKVGWSSSQLRFGINDSNLPLAAFGSENLEVIGNLYENPELLKEEK